MEENNQTEDKDVKIQTLEAVNEHLRASLEELRISLEIANERWVETVNKLTVAEIQIRKSKKKEEQ